MRGSMLIKDLELSTRLINAGGSDMIAEEEEQSRWINGSLDLPALDPFGLWFHCDKEKKALDPFGLCDEVSDLLGTIKTKKDALRETHPEDDIDDNEIYIETVKGFNKKGEVWGMGKETSYYYDKPLPSSKASKAGGSKKSYTPGFVSKLYSQNQAIKEEFSDMRQWKLQLEQTLASQGIHITTQSCNLNSQPHNVNDRHPDDNEGNVGNRSPQILGC